MRLNIAAGMAVRFEPGEEKDVVVVEFGGYKKVFGFNYLVDGDLVNKKETALTKADSENFNNTKE